jgi:hypothetical protein
MEQAVHREVTDEVVEQASLYVLGALPVEERAAFATHVAGCGTCRREVERFGGVAEHLAFAVAPLAPRPEVRARLLAALAGEPAPASAAWTVTRAGEGRWTREAGGAETRPLFADAAGVRTTALGRLGSGERYARQGLESVEELYLLEGDLVIDGETLGAGDYCAAPAGAAHGDATSRGGCTFLRVTSRPAAGDDPRLTVVASSS